MLKTAVLSGGIDPECTLHLMDPAESLHPWMIEYVLFGNLFRVLVAVGRVLHVPVNRIIDEAYAFVRGDVLRHGSPNVAFRSANQGVRYL
jgi:hypothetical protein